MDAKPKPLSADERTEVLAILRTQDSILGLPIVQRVAATFGQVAALEAQVAAMRKAGGKLADRLIGLHKPLVGRPIDRELADWRKAAGG